MSPHKDIEQVAAQWINRAESPQWTAQDQIQLQAWLEQDTAHRVAWLRLKSVWTRADRLAAVRAVQPPRIHRWREPMRWAIAASVAMLAVLFTLTGWGPGTRYSTEVGGREVILGVSLATLCNFANVFARTPLNPELARYSWTRPE